ncbi:sugar lactone lactonase YvrE [Bradyrhizobium sp. GM6.1]
MSFGTSGPDGLTMDQNGRLFVALASLGHVFVMAPNGETIARIKSCAGATCTNLVLEAANGTLLITESSTESVLMADFVTLPSLNVRQQERQRGTESLYATVHRIKLQEEAP